ncbi:helix-turn-helix transcriptional regulator [Streptomyces humidus]|uniref:Helix-turn-helix transcriptional regulator n=1 Tax=Streptomyces humidus TaxID=52259 RepID=A0A918G228_9ACTN|nr:helix-turn-helix transcriptional regulator [Streptomyces humidus]
MGRAMAGHGTEDHPHGADRLCEAGDRVYARAVRRGRVARADAEPVPCLLELALLHPDPDDMDWLVPTSPQEVMTRLLRGLHDEVSASQRRMGSAVAAFEWYAGLGGPERAAGGEGAAIRVLDGPSRIQAALDAATEACTTEVLTVQPGGIRREHELSEGLHRALELRGRGVRMRDLYNHVARHGQGLLNYLELMGDTVEARTLDEVIDRLMLFDRTVAFVPANADRTMALELRHPALVSYLVTVFERLWRLAIPLTAPLPDPRVEGVSHREQSIAALLAEGHQDAVIAERLGISVRTCRAHIARLSETLGAASRTQLGVRIAQVGLDRPSDEEAPGGVAGGAAGVPAQRPGPGPGATVAPSADSSVEPAPAPDPARASESASAPASTAAQAAPSATASASAATPGPVPGPDPAPAPGAVPGQGSPTAL